MTRGLISMRDTRTPLVTNTVQLGLRIVLISLLIGQLGTLAIPLAFVVSCSLETVALASVLVVRLRRRTQVSGTRRQTLVV